MNDPEVAKAVRAEYDNAVAAGGTGTPFNVFFIKGATEPVAVPGALLEFQQFFDRNRRDELPRLQFVAFQQPC